MRQTPQIPGSAGGQLPISEIFDGVSHGRVGVDALRGDLFGGQQGGDRIGFPAPQMSQRPAQIGMERGLPPRSLRQSLGMDPVLRLYGLAVQAKVGVEADVVDSDVGGAEVQVPGPCLPRTVGEVGSFGEMVADLFRTGLSRPLSVLSQAGGGDQVELASLARAALARGGGAMGRTAEQRIAQAVMDALFGSGTLERLLADETIENICVNGCDAVWIRRADGTWQPGAPVAASDTELIELVRTLAASVDGEERRFDRGVPRLNLQLPDGSRLFAVMAVTGRVSLSVRRHRFPAASMDDTGHHQPRTSR
ncbi:MULTISPECIES: hypothetical protein [unclassified Streptomyces]|nr:MULTISPECIES: hypothetical protein [unclassified Streptomyces]WTB03062.1 hypothetical protein OG546_01700 [Streptomyces antimycoticus]